mmetsp:Transcript_37000/g.94588  ORF Transcript_37000/g.94588 Transcript_37000/m.94588 type:complete len:211 (+) Transcript_37000:183-815(+)
MDLVAVYSIMGCISPLDMRIAPVRSPLWAALKGCPGAPLPASFSQGWFRASRALSRLPTSTVSSLPTRSFAASVTSSQTGSSMSYRPFLILSKRATSLSSSNGEYPDSRMNRMTPTLHMSTAGVYSSTVTPTDKISGATYCGEPHMVFSNESGSMSLASPKSAILTGESSRSFSRIRFSSLRSRCTIPRECRYATPSRICVIICAASCSV